MNNRNFLYVPVAIMLACASCGNNSRQESLDRIAKVEDSIDIQNTLVDSEMGMRLIENYVNFSSQFPQDSLAPVFWHRAAQVAANIHRPDLAVLYLDTVINNYADYKQLAECCFYKGFVLENVAHDIENARIAYQTFVDRYPDDPLAKDTRVLIENLGLSPEELLAKVLQNADTSAVANN